MRWRTVLGVMVGLAVLAYGVVVAWPSATATGWWNSIPRDAQPMVVSEVLSGDTVVLISDRPGQQVPKWGKVTARLLGVNAPNFGIQSECYAVESEARLTELLPEGSVAWVAIDSTPRDDNGRWLMYLWAGDGRLVNEVLAVDGYVRTEHTESNDRFWATISRAGSQAAARFGGLWGECH